MQSTGLAGKNTSFGSTGRVELKVPPSEGSHSPFVMVIEPLVWGASERQTCTFHWVSNVLVPLEYLTVIG